MGIKCCRNCTDRFVGCHAVCDTYIKERAVYDKEQAEIRKEREASARLLDFKIDSYNNMLRSKGRKR